MHSSLNCKLHALPTCMTLVRGGPRAEISKLLLQCPLRVKVPKTSKNDKELQLEQLIVEIQTARWVLGDDECHIVAI